MTHTAPGAGLCRCGCGQPVRFGTLRLADSCYQWWRLHGRPEHIPLPAVRQLNRAAGGRASAERREGRIEDYQFIGGDRMSAQRAAERLGVSARTVVRYRAVLRGPEVTA